MLFMLVWLVAFVIGIAVAVKTFIASVDSVLKLRELVSTSWLEIWTQPFVLWVVYLILLFFVILLNEKKKS